MHEKYPLCARDSRNNLITLLNYAINTSMEPNVTSKAGNSQPSSELKLTIEQSGARRRAGLRQLKTRYE